MNTVDAKSTSEATVSSPAIRVLERLFRDCAAPGVIRLWDDQCYRIGSGAAEFTLVVRDPAVLRRLVFRRGSLSLAESYCNGDMDIEGDLYRALELKQHFEWIRLSRRDKLALAMDTLQLPVRQARTGGPSSGLGANMAKFFSHRHTRDSDRLAIAFHYDISDDFYGLWLDPERVYSCAYFRSPQDSLDSAQRNKLDHICRKLRLQRGERLLDIGCGWGALACWAAREYGVHVHGITLSKNQLRYARRRAHAEGLEDRVSFERLDYRDLPGDELYDKVASIGMFEHVGLENLPAYHAAVRRVLRPGGLFLNHGITDVEGGWKPSTGTAFINRFVFPGGELDRMSRIQQDMEEAGFEIHDVEGLRPHYALTLRHWVRRLQAHRNEAVHMVGESRYRIWLLYMAACALQFEAGRIGLHQILASSPNHGSWSLPMTRDDLYVDRLQLTKP